MKHVRNVASWFLAKKSRRELFCFSLLFGMALGLAAHAFMFVNKIPNHDDLYYYLDLKNAGIPAGRYFLYFFWKLFSDMSTPWLNGLLGLFFTSLSAFFLCDAMDWRHNWQAVSVGLIMQLYPANMSIYCYMYEAHVLMLGIMFASLAPWMMKHGGKFGWLFCTLTVWIASGIYQINVMLAIGFLILFVMHHVFISVKTGEKGIHIWGMAVKCATAALAGLGLYLIGLKLSTRLFHVVLNEYQGVNQTGNLDLALVPGKIRQAYQMIWDEFVADVPDYVNGRMHIFRASIVLLGLAGAVGSIVWCMVRRAPAHALLIVLCSLLLPLAGCGILFMGNDITMLHVITFYPQIIMLLLLIVIAGTAELTAEGLKRAAALGTAVLYLGYGFNGVVLSNQFYYRHYQAFTRAEHFANRLAARIEETEGYYPGILLRTWGYMEADSLYFEYDIASRFLAFAGLRMEPDYFWPYCAVNMLNAVIGLPVGEGKEWNPQTAEGMEMIENMPCYPAKDSIAIVEGVCVVKFHD